MRARSGLGVVELVVTLAVGAIVAAALTSTLLTELRVVRVAAARLARGEAVRTSLHVLAAELRLASPHRDLHGLGTDSVSARLPRLSGVTCALAPGRIWVRAAGMREPAPEKDSLLVLSVRAERAFGIAAAVMDPGACAPSPGQTVYRLDVADDAPTPGAAIIFESGHYYLRDRALRFRLGREGRQPLTEELLRDAGSGLALRDDSTGATLQVDIAVRAPAGIPQTAPASVRFRLLNGLAGR